MHLGRFDDAVTELQRSLTVPRVDKVSQAINLAELFCELNRPDEALSVLPKMDDASEYGKTQIALIELIVATERGETAAVQKGLDYLGDHQEVAPATYQQALLIAGESGKAEAFLLSRLTDTGKCTAALVGLQTYADLKRPPRVQAWHIAYEQLKAMPAIQRAIAQVGFVRR
jgi:thioredoxin-like negative regulator of GroEL